MPADEADRPVVLDYATPATPARVFFFLSRMLLWRSIAIWSLVALIAGPFLFGYLAAVAMISSIVVRAAVLTWAVAVTAFVIATVLTFYYMTRAAAREAGPGYGVRQLLLALISLPLFFWGLLLVPLLLESDIIERHRPTDEPPA